MVDNPKKMLWFRFRSRFHDGGGRLSFPPAAHSSKYTYDFPKAIQQMNGNSWKVWEMYHQSAISLWGKTLWTEFGFIFQSLVFPFLFGAAVKWERSIPGGRSTPTTSRRRLNGMELVKIMQRKKEERREEKIWQFTGDGKANNVLLESI